MNNYIIDCKIGKGGVGEVYKAIKGNENYAIKIIDKNGENYREDLTKNEIRIQSESDHPNIVKIIETFQYEEKIYIVLELCEENLYQYLNQKKFLEESEILTIFKQIANAVKYLHDKNITHRDIKMDNILKTGDNWKLIDFGFASKERFFSQPVGTIDYLAPEIVSYKKFRGFPVDMWTLGIILYEMLYSRPPFFYKKYMDTYGAILKNSPSFTERDITPSIKNIIILLLEKDPDKRININELLIIL